MNQYASNNRKQLQMKINKYAKQKNCKKKKKNEFSEMIQIIIGPF